MARRTLGPASLAVVQAVDALPPAGWVVACSGGADSLALAWAAAHVAGRRGTPCRAVVIDHALQPGSDAVAAVVAATLTAVGLPTEVIRVDVVDAGAGPEASAREARYAALVASAAGDSVLLGHTLDDQAETVLLGLARGSGTRSLAGMPATRGVFRRPLLEVTRDTTAACCAEQGLTPWCDPMNDDHRYARVRVRASVLPTLERELGPGVREALARTARLARSDADFLDEIADMVAPDDDPGCAWLAGLAPALRDRVLRDWLRRCGAPDVGSGHVAAVTALVLDWRGQKGVDVPGGRVVRRDGRLLHRPSER